MNSPITNSLAANEPLGATAARLGFVTPEQVIEALDEQRRRRAQGENRRLGLLMIEMGLLNAAQLDEVLRQYEALRPAVRDEACHLAVRLRAGLADQDRTILFTSAGPGEGVTSTAYQVGLGLALMDQGHVLIVDANYRTPALEKMVRRYNPSHRDASVAVPGLSELIRGEAEFVDALFPTPLRALSLLSTGSTDVDFLALMLSEHCSRVLRVLRENFRFILIDAPPILRYPDAALLATRADAAVMVVAAGRCRRGQVDEMRRSLEMMRVPLLASVLVEGDSR
ncbi:MAG TPA: hypothetical protein PLS90_03875 [Candidatus Sumerlaeota bacterium]|nr:MAG: Tyrosine-protein kinase CpsD [candidate division BRC1 bacterium ADurb.BinA292]HOE95739.1 hypothetical protein [Candidatus Sumerlaeota bacterium]HOR26821.1 hypothetical protein [Candidatus Sumerlaeota bacterium]HPK01575.1 hypothetical protein [Candidatus Sumerlaeota bacterium]